MVQGGKSRLRKSSFKKSLQKRKEVLNHELLFEGLELLWHPSGATGKDAYDVIRMTHNHCHVISSLAPIFPVSHHRGLPEKAEMDLWL